MALSCTPIPPDPGCESTCGFHIHSTCNSAQAATGGRIRPEATDIAVMHQKGSVGRLFIADPIPYESRVKHTVPKNHYKENFKRIQKIQAKSKEKHMESQKSVTELQKSAKYGSVPPKVFMQSSNTSVVPSTVDELLLESQAKQTLLQHKQSCDVHDTEVKSKKNFLAMNIERAARAQVKQPPSQQRLAAVSAKREKQFSKYKRGIIPQYLQERKVEWRKAEEQRIASLPDPSIPPGHTLMPDKERRSTLSVLQEYISVLVAELQALPLHSDTLRVQKKKAQLDGKLAEIEDAIKIFSKPKVFIKVDA